MGILKMLADAIMKRGGATLITWIVLMLFTIMVYAGFTPEPLDGPALRGMALTHGVLAILGVELWRWVKRRRSSRTTPASGPTTDGGKHVD